jgi:hypothetical protein
MDEIPYSSPEDPSPVVGWDSTKFSPSTLAEIRQIALLQKGVILAIAAQIGLIVASQVASPEFRPVLALAFMGVAITTVICTWLLAITLYGMGIGVLMAIATGIPCIGIFFLVTLNGRATEELKECGVPVHFFGVPWASIPARN